VLAGPENQRRTAHRVARQQAAQNATLLVVEALEGDRARLLARLEAAGEVGGDHTPVQGQATVSRQLARQDHRHGRALRGHAPRDQAAAAPRELDQGGGAGEHAVAEADHGAVGEARRGAPFRTRVERVQDQEPERRRVEGAAHQEVGTLALDLALQRLGHLVRHDDPEGRRQRRLLARNARRDQPARVADLQRGRAILRLVFRHPLDAELF